MLDDSDARLLGAVVGGCGLVVATALVADAAGVTGVPAFAAPLLVGIAVGAGIVAFD